VGERVGNPAIEQLVANLVVEYPSAAGSLRAMELPKYCEIAARALSIAISSLAPIVGRDAFRTGTGVHAAAILRAETSDDESLADSIYSAIPARAVGRKQEVTVSFVSGASNVRHWLVAHGFEPTDDRVASLLSRAKAADFTLGDADLLAHLAAISSGQDDGRHE
jgi:2-isopropylmalate synthase